VPNFKTPTLRVLAETMPVSRDKARTKVKKINKNSIDRFQKDWFPSMCWCEI
jgi:hypothetical protein